MQRQIVQLDGGGMKAVYLSAVEKGWNVRSREKETAQRDAALRAVPPKLRRPDRK